MRIEHFNLLSWVHERTTPQNTKAMRKMARGWSRSEISVRRSCHGSHVSDGVHPFGSYGHHARCTQRPDCCWMIWRMATIEDRNRSLCDHAKTRARGRAHSTKSTTNVVLFQQCLVARLVLLLDVVEKGAARRHELQKTAARMIVLHVGLEVAGKVVDAFRQDRDLNLGRAGVAGLGSTRLDDFRFAFGGNRHRQILSLRPELAVSPVRLNTRLGMSSPLPISSRARSRPATVT